VKDPTDMTVVPPTLGVLSTRTTLSPLLADDTAAARPEPPPPTITTSTERGRGDWEDFVISVFFLSGKNRYRFQYNLWSGILATVSLRLTYPGNNK
jgi:hypothetical protein